MSGAPTFSKTYSFPHSFVPYQCPQNVRISRHLFVFSSHQGLVKRRLTLEIYCGPHLNGGRRQIALRVCGRSPRNHLAGPVPKRSSRSLGARCHVLPPVSQVPFPKLGHTRRALYLADNPTALLCLASLMGPAHHVPMGSRGFPSARLVALDLEGQRRN